MSHMRNIRNMKIDHQPSLTVKKSMLYFLGGFLSHIQMWLCSGIHTAAAAVGI